MKTSIRQHTFRRADAGQTLIFMVLALMILAFAVIWQVDLHQVLHLKSRAQNAGDAAALAAARWQGTTLNLIGDLNIMQAVALSQGATQALDEVTELQARLCYAGPLIGLLAAQQAAKNNGLFVHPGYTERLRQQAQKVENDYPIVYPNEPYIGCWQEYASMLNAVCDEGVVAGPDNTHLYSDVDGSHILMDLSFYDAVSGKDWCWFHWHDPALLDSYTDYSSWPTLPTEPPEPHPYNSEIFGLGLMPSSTPLGQPVIVTNLNRLRDDRGLSGSLIVPGLITNTATWHVYNPALWGSWSNISMTGEDPFPAAGPVKPQYDYAGADAAVRVQAQTELLTPASNLTSKTITWTAAAKSFGYLDTDDAPITPHAYGLVLPAFHQVRLIPMDASSSPAGGAYDLEWQTHMTDHLPLYLQSGPLALDTACRYCQSLQTWEHPEFRQEGIDWLSDTNHICATSGGNPHASGGRRRGH